MEDIKLIRGTLDGVTNYFSSKYQASLYYKINPCTVYNMLTKKNNKSSKLPLLKLEYITTDTDDTNINVVKQPDPRKCRTKYTPEQKKELLRMWARKQHQRAREKKNAAKEQQKEQEQTKN